MDYRPYILAGTFLLFVVALITFLTTVFRSRTHHHRHFTHNGAASGPAPSLPMDTSLEGLELVVAEDAPSASLLKPLKESEWMPEESATSQQLADVSLAERVANYIPAPQVPEPAFSVETYPEWKVPSGPSVESPAADALPEMPATPSWAAGVPEVHPVETQPEPEVEDDFSDEAFSAQIAALLPSGEESPLPPSHDVERIEIVHLPEIETADRPRAEARQASEDRPSVTVIAAQPPEPVRQQAEAPAPRAPRPSVRVFAEGGGGTVVESGPADIARTNDPRRSHAPEVVMSAPVEIWFGESRVGVKAGTETYERFRKYADILLSDLKGALRETR